MAANLALLQPSLKRKVEELIRVCGQHGFEMRPNNGLRDPFEQARLWRQSRSTEEIEKKIDELKRSGADFLAHCIVVVGPHHGKRVTNAPPGFSWHQWGEAVDCFWVLNGKAEWSTSLLINGENAYHVYADTAKNLGLTPGGHWPNFKDWPHVQAHQEDSPASKNSTAEINEKMRAMYENKMANA